MCCHLGGIILPTPGLDRGLEAGSLVFHQATLTTKQLDDGILIPGEHYVELKPDLSDLLAQVSHYMEHPAEAREIAEAGHDFRIYSG